MRAVRPQCELLYVGNYLDPSFDLFSLVGCSITESPRREVVRSSAGAGVIYPPLFWGHLRSIPQGMILDVQPNHYFAQ